MLAVFCAGAVAATSHYQMSVRIDPAARTLEGHASVALPEGRKRELAVGAPFVIESRKDDGGRVDIRWRGTVEQVAFLAGESGWYPRIPGELATYEVSLEISGGQVAVLPGTLLEEKRDAASYSARFALCQPSEAIDLMTGPYRIEERMHKGAGGKPIRLRTYFHPEVAAFSAAYLDSVAEYLDLYERRIGEYPFDGFSVVSSPTPTGYGMAGLTYLGIEVLKLPFIRGTSLGHEVLHNWWGNGVYVDYARGNWAEGLTTFMADYAYREKAGAAAAREMRLAWLRDIAAVPPGKEEPLVAFRARTHATSQILGYGKAAMVFHMLRDELGSEPFDAALRAFWDRQRFRSAAWSDLQQAFESVSGRSLEHFFSQWLQRRGVPRVRIASATAARRAGVWRVTVALEQDEPPYVLRVPIVADGKMTHVFDFSRAKARFHFDSGEKPVELALDPDLRVLRRLARNEAPPILRGMMVAPAPGLAVLTPALREPAEQLASRLFDHPRGAGAPTLAIGVHADVDAWLARQRLSRPAEVAGKGTAQAWMVPRGGAPLAVVSVRDAQALAALSRPLPHYGAQSFIVFEDRKAIEQGVWPSRPQTVRIE